MLGSVHIIAVPAGHSRQFLCETQAGVRVILGSMARTKRGVVAKNWRECAGELCEHYLRKLWLKHAQSPVNPPLWEGGIQTARAQRSLTPAAKYVERLIFKAEKSTYPKLAST